MRMNGLLDWRSRPSKRDCGVQTGRNPRQHSCWHCSLCTSPACFQNLLHLLRSGSGTSRRFAATQHSVAFGAKRTLTDPRAYRERICVPTNSCCAEGRRPLVGAEAAHHRIHHGLKDSQRVLHRRVDDVEEWIDLADLPATDPRVPDQRLVEQPSLLEEDPVR